MNKPISKAVLSLLAASLAFGSAVMAETPATNVSAASIVQRFPDVALSHWATRHINKLALLGIVEGNEKGQYEPEASVTQEQVITMSIRMMGFDADAKNMNNVSSYVLPFDVSDYAKPYVILAIEKGLIDHTEELSIAQTGTGTWGQRPATREWVAKLAIRTIGKQDEAIKLEMKASQFLDNANISPWALGYINEAVDLKIVDGMEDGTFKPKDPVTRAQMATFLSRAGKFAAEGAAGTAVGVLNNITDQTLDLVDEFGASSTYTLSDQTVYYGLQNDSAIGRKDLKPEQKVYLIVSNGIILYMEVLEEQAEVNDSLEGILISMDLAEAKMTLKVGDREAVADLLIPPTIVDSEGKGLPLSDVQPGSVLQLIRTGSKAKYSTIIVKHIPVNKTAEGVVQSINLVDWKITVLEKETGVAEYPISEQATYIINGAEGDLATIVPRDTIQYRIVNDVLSHIDMVAPYVEPSDIGKMVEFRSDRNISYITLQKENNQFATYAIAGTADVIIPGMQYAAFKDLLVGDQVKVMLDDNHAAVQITVTNRSMKTEYMKSVISYDVESKMLTVINADGTPGVYVLSDETRLDIAGTALPLQNAATFLTKGKKVDITASSDTHVKEIRLVYNYEGMVAQPVADGSDLTLKIGDQLIAFKLLAGTKVELLNNSAAKLSELTVGDRVNVSFDAAQTSINRIQAIKTAVYRLTDKNETTRKLTFKDEAGVFHNLTLAAGVKIYDQNLKEAGFGNLQLEEPVHIQYIGANIDRVMIAPVYRGKVTSLDAANGKLTLSLADGSNPTITVGASVKVGKDGGAAQSSFADIKAGDRLEIVKDPEGAYSITVAQAVQKKVYYYDGTSKSLFVYRDLLSEQPSYLFHTSAYLHKGSETITVAGLKTNDSVILYTIDNKVIELDKQ